MPTPLDLKKSVELGTLRRKIQPKETEKKQNFTFPDKHNPSILIDTSRHPDMRKMQKWFDDQFKEGLLPLSVDSCFRKTQTGPNNPGSWLVVQLWIPEDLSFNATQVFGRNGGSLNFSEEKASWEFVEAFERLIQDAEERQFLGDKGRPGVEYRFKREKDVKDEASMERIRQRKIRGR